MATTIQANCPKCRQTLYIPADWLGQTVRCKHCGQTMEARPRPAPTVAPAAEGDSFTSDTVTDSNPFAVSPMISRKANVRRGRRVQSWLVAAVVLLVLIGGAVAGGFAIYRFTTPAANSTAQTTGPEGGGETGGKSTFLPAAAGPYPRRVLAVSVSNYLYANPTNYGAEGPNARNPLRHDVHSLLNAFASAWFVPKTELFELADYAPGNQARPPLKPVIEQTVDQFLSTSRPQDRIILLFVGHAVAIDKEAYLVPLEGDLQDARTLVPLKWLYEKLAACKAQQKLFVADVCRLDPARGQERPGSGPMAKDLEAVLKAPPAGVQVLSACSAGQFSYEFDYQAVPEVGEVKGGLFLNAFFPTLRDGFRDLRKPEQPLPVNELAARLKATLDAAGHAIPAAQTPFLAGAAEPNGVPYDPKEEPARTVVVPQPTVAGGAAPKELVRAIFQQVEVPPVRLAREGSTAASLEDVLPFPAELMAKYADDVSVNEIRANPDKYKLRVAVLDAVQLLRTIRTAQGSAAGDLPEVLKEEPDDKFNERLKRNQRKLGEVELMLQEAEEKLKAVEDVKEKSPRWRANYEFVLAEVELRRAYWLEYNLMFGKVRKRELPPLNKSLKQTGWRLAATEKLTGTGDALEKLKDARKRLAKLIKDHKGTPWEILARREQFTAVGLQWVATSFAD